MGRVSPSITKVRITLRSWWRWSL